MKTKKYKRLTFKERVIIQTLIDEKKSQTFIAKKFNRASISRKVNKLAQSKDDTTLANWLAKDDYLNKRNLDKINPCNKLKLFVYKGYCKVSCQIKSPVDSGINILMIR